MNNTQFWWKLDTKMVSDTIKFNIDKVVTRKVKIEIDTTSSTLAQNFRLGSTISIDPPFVDIKGPTSVLQELDGVLKVKLGEDKINKDFNKLIPLTLPSAYTDFLTLEEESVQVKFDVFQMLEGNKRLKIKMLNYLSLVKSLSLLLSKCQSHFLKMSLKIQEVFLLLFLKQQNSVFGFYHINS